MVVLWELWEGNMKEIKDWRMKKIENLIELKRIIKKESDIETILAVANVTEPYLSKSTTFKYLKDLEKAKIVKIDKEKGKVFMCS